MEFGEGSLTDFLDLIVKGDKSLYKDQLKQITLGIFIMKRDEINYWEQNNL
jgi:hypothetical protein